MNDAISASSLRLSSGSRVSSFVSLATATMCGSFGCRSGSPVTRRHTSSFGIAACLKPSTITRSHGERRASCASNAGSAAPRNSCISTQRRDEVTSTSAAPAWRCRYESLPGWSTSNVWCACLMSDTRSPEPAKRGMSFSMSVVLPLPDQPAKPKTFTRRFYQPRRGAICAPRLRSLVRVGKEELLAVDLVGRDGLLACGRDEPVDKCLAPLLLHVGMLHGIDQHHAALVEEALVALDNDGEIAPILEREPRATVGEDVGVHPGGGVERGPHALARVPVPRAFL